MTNPKDSKAHKAVEEIESLSQDKPDSLEHYCVESVPTKDLIDLPPELFTDGCDEDPANDGPEVKALKHVLGLVSPWRL